MEDQVITLTETIVYSFAGGQQSDDATVDGIKIVDPRKSGTAIFYTVERADGLFVGKEVELEINWEKRSRIMKLHFAAELVLELMNQHYDRPVKFGANITSEKSRVDFIWERDISETFPLLEQRLRKLIIADLPIESLFVDEAAEIRCWRIRGFGQVHCGGTHIKRTGELGQLTLKRKTQGKNKERIEIYLAAV
ncbi:alanyl-tRNA editing protein [Niabella sp. CC-SYL272]|uniref:alanyl-tRNA editing protein n=1 Tax=Niabella agricola TaxID=2891571 RepID=UPI001F3880F8|nr:alanyl-tRNA editing protein [Niabella agricola]MCF3110255.1 alanyl-tRNA editing protein [Niabella agricola]